MADSEQKGMQLVAEAEKKMKSAQSFFGSLMGGTNKLEEAADLYHRGANMFKMAKKWSAAGSAFCEAAMLHNKLDSKHNAATSYVDAGTCYKKSDPQEAVNCLLKAIEIYTDMGRFSMAAKHHCTVAEIYETEIVDIERAISNYEQAADYFKGEESNSSANKCLLSVAKHCGQLEQYDKAIEIYEQVAANSLDSSLLKYAAKEYFFKAALCHLCIDFLNAQHAITKYDLMYPAFQDSRERKFVTKLIGCVEEENVDGFTDAVKDYDSISRLDQWYTTILLRIKKSMNENPELL